jgi:hypothetical protein
MMYDVRIVEIGDVQQSGGKKMAQMNGDEWVICA